MDFGRSRRGGGSAPQKCRTALRSCMINETGKGGLRSAAKNCMSAFNRCRSKRIPRAQRKYGPGWTPYKGGMRKVYK